MPAARLWQAPAKTSMNRTACFTLVLLGLACGPQANAQAPAPADAESLSAKATDPTASLMSFQVNDWYVPSLYGSDDSANQVVLRTALPLTFWGANHILRLTQPFATSGPAGSGAGDLTVFDVMVFDAAWGRWALGFAGQLPTGAARLTSDRWSIGPAAGFVNARTRGTSWGVFVQSYFSVAGRDSAPQLGIVNIQPVFSHQLGGGRSVSLGASQLVWDTEASRWSSLQLGVNYGQVVHAWGHAWRPNVEIDREFRDLTGNPKWTLRLGVTLLLPR